MGLRDRAQAGGVTSCEVGEPIVLRSWPYAKPDPEHGYVFYVFGSYLKTGRLVYAPDPEETARRLAQQQPLEGMDALHAD